MKKAHITDPNGEGPMRAEMVEHYRPVGEKAGQLDRTAHTVVHFDISEPTQHFSMGSDDDKGGIVRVGVRRRISKKSSPQQLMKERGGQSLDDNGSARFAALLARVRAKQCSRNILADNPSTTPNGFSRQGVGVRATRVRGGLYR